MPDRDEIQRIAAAMNDVRLDWRVTSLVTFLTTHHADRPYRDLLIAGIVVASDPKTKTPHLLNEHGAWWIAAQVASGSGTPTAVPRPSDPRCTIPGHERELARNCVICITDKRGGVDRADPPTLSDEQIARNKAGAAAVRAALKPAEHQPEGTPA